MKRLIQLYNDWKGADPKHISPLPKAGSNRKYYRLYDDMGKSTIGVVGTSWDENHSFIYLSRHLSAKGLPAPQILAVSEDENCYIQEDLGHTSLYDLLKNARENGFHYTEEDCAEIEKTVRLLPHIQIENHKDLDYSQCLTPRQFDAASIKFDLNYFKYCFLKPSDLHFDEIALEADFETFSQHLSKTMPQHFLYRDFQARNVMMKDGKPYLIDYQGGRKGPLQYDLVCFLWQASSRYPRQLKERMIDAYLDELGKLIPTDKDIFKKTLKKFVLFRTLQVLGAYGLRGYFEHKQYFLDSIPAAIDNLDECLKEGASAEYSCLYDTLQRLVALEKSQRNETTQKSAEKQPLAKELLAHQTENPLVVRIFSFSYKKGIPEDSSGNGGGYVFDCRSTHNPGRYEPYKSITGLDEPVIKFLEDDGEILDFLKSVYPLAEHHVECFMKRGFTNLMFSFGCTGGQHRSVYCAQHLAEHLHGKYGIEIRLCHREQGINSVLPQNHTRVFTNENLENT